MIKETHETEIPKYSQEATSPLMKPTGRQKKWSFEGENIAKQNLDKHAEQLLLRTNQQPTHTKW